MKRQFLEFEKPIAELSNKIEALPWSSLATLFYKEAGIISSFVKFAM